MRRSRPRLVVAYGGTVEAIDEVRVLTNLSRGALGRELVATALARGFAVHALVSVLSEAPPASPRLSVERFTSARDLAQRLRALLTTARAPVSVVMAAAVADYRPRRVARAKLSSRPPTRTITLVKNPKIVDAIHRWQPGARLVSFKLLGHAADERTLRARAQLQLARTGSLAVVANRWPRAGKHLAHLLTPGRWRPLAGRRAIAAAVVGLLDRARDRDQRSDDIGAGYP